MIRTGHSFKIAYGHLEDVASRLKEINWRYFPIADRCSTFGFRKWSHLVPTPIFGVELAVSIDSPITKNTPRDYWTFLAISDLKPLHDLIGVATSVKTGEPVLTYKQALRAKGLIKITGPWVLFDHIKPEKVYIGLSPALPLGLYKKLKKNKFKFVAAQDNHYPRIEDKEIYRVTSWRGGMQTYPQHILSDEEWKEACYTIADKDLNAAITLRNKLLATCHAKLSRATLYKPERPATLRAMCEVGAKAKGIDLTDQIYASRLDRELDMIAMKKFEDYFYIITDLVSWAKKRMVVGPARGSSCGSLVCYLLDITAIDPIPFNLVFERFIDINRSDLPDIDLDFSDIQRDAVFNYASDKYGRERVARLGTVGMFRPKSILNTFGAALKVPVWQTNKLSESLIIRSSGDARANQQYEDTLKDTLAGRELLADYPNMILGSRLEDHPTFAGQHAAGLCITQDAIDKYVAIDHRTFSTMCDKKDAEEYNMLKIDMLGLTQLSIFERTMQLLGLEPKSGWLEKIPLNDPAAFEVLNRQHYSGIFQFNGLALKSLSRQIHFDSINDIIAITALARPGPLAAGGAADWVKRRMKQERVTYLHPSLEPYLKDTFGVVVFQEQIMRIGREIGDLTWEDVTALRQSMSKSLGAEYFNKWGDRWKAGAIKRGFSKEEANKFWDAMCQFGSWAFNLAHSVAYGVVSYWCCWLKAHHPLEFAAATLDAESLPMRQITVLRELKEEGIDYIPVDPHLSGDRWSIGVRDGKKFLMGPLTLISGIGPAFMLEIMEARKNGNKLRPVLQNKLENIKTEIDSLYPIRDAINALHPDLAAIKIFTTPTPIHDVQAGITNGPVVIMGVLSRVAPRDANDPQYVARRIARGVPGKVSGPTTQLHMFVRDDTDEIFVKINRGLDFETMGRKIAETGRVGNSIYAFKGTCPYGFRMISVTGVKHLGEMDQVDGIRVTDEDPRGGGPNKEEFKERTPNEE